MPKSDNSKIAAYCPGCDTQIRFKRQPHRGQLITCPECEDMLEVVQTSPIVLEWAFEDDEMWIDDDGSDLPAEDKYAYNDFEEADFDF
ncbi:MAG: hypothetical protein KDE48_09475 [Anaerolineales bacterium]|nr:hypothetical protein [Anaerolineales bacterium]